MAEFSSSSSPYNCQKTRKGRKKGRLYIGSIVCRKGDWGKLIDLWEEDVKLVNEKNARRSVALRQPLTEDEEKNK